MIGDYLEKYTFEYLIDQALSHVPDTLDKREGSIIYDAIAPACYELAEFYINLRKVFSNVFVSTASGEYLDNRAIERGLVRYPATKALRKGMFTANGGVPAAIPIGSRFSTLNGDRSVNFVVQGQYTNEGIVEPGSYVLECEEFGTIGNDYTGNLMTLTNISGLAAAIITTIVTPARDMESDEELRARYMLTINQNPFGGNAAQYDQEIKKITGVGEVQIYPTWNGGGTVKCSVVGADYQPISTDFINQIQEEVDPSPQGAGIGIAPIGHTVTITTPTAKTINITAKVLVDNRYTVNYFADSIKKAIEDYFTSLRVAWGNSDDYGNYSLGIYIARISNAIFSVEGVLNVTNVTINGSAADLMLSQTATLQELPILGTVTLNE